MGSVLHSAPEGRTSSSGSHRTLNWLWGTVLVAVLIGFTVLFSVMLMDQRQRDWQQAEISARNVGASVRRDIVQTFHGADLALLSARELIGAEPDFRFSPRNRRALLGGSVSQQGLGEIDVLDASGNLVLSSQTSPRTKTNFGNDAFFYTHERSDADHLYIAKTVTLSPMKDIVVVLSRRLSDEKGDFAGVVAFSLRLSVFGPLFRSLDMGEKGVISLFATDGTLLLRTPDIEGKIGKSFLTTPMFWDVATKTVPFRTVSAIDGVDRLFNSSHVDDLPLIVAVGLSVDEIYAGWIRQAIMTTLAFVILAGCVIFLSVLLGLELRHRRRSEDRYRTLAHIDGLTGLFNRRRFDAVLEDEFDACRRLNTPLSVIMIDVDRFKLYNDHYGHQAGDDCLKLIARIIQSHMKRAGDVVARYGGEEIAVILPNTDIAGCSVIADQIRSAIVDHALPHARGDSGIVTASFGTATSHPDTALPATPAELIAAADEALYGAKRSGRNRVVSSVELKTGIAALPPANEAARIVQVKALLKRMTKEDRTGLDRISHMATQAFGTETAFVTLVDATERCFVGRSGLNSAGSAREVSFCAHALNGQEALVVLDAARDIRFSGNALVTGEPHIRFYAGAPLRDAETGVTLGTLCVLDPSPRTTFSETQRELLFGFAAMAMEQLQAMRAPVPMQNAGASAAPVLLADRQRQAG